MRRLSVILVLGFVIAVSAFVASGSSSPGFRGNPLLNMANAARHGIAPPRLPNGNFVAQPSGGYVHSGLNAASEARLKASGGGSSATVAPKIGVSGCPNTYTAPGRPDNVRANQDCGYRFQAEEWVAVNPKDGSNVVVSQNDSSLSGNHTGVEYSINDGKSFGDSRLPSGRITIPGAPGGLWSFDFFSDPVHEFDSHGNLYYVTLGADFAQDAFDGVFVWKSNSCLKGAALHTPGSGSCHPFSPPYDATAIPIRTNFDNPGLEDDKEQMAIDTGKSSPFKDNIYVTWTIFDFTCGSDQASFCDSPIFFSKSSDGGQTWSRATEISGRSPECNYGDAFDSSQPPDACNIDQYSDPVVGPDGKLYVFFMNFNTDATTVSAPGGLRNQIMMVKSTDGGNTWSSPSRVTWDIGTEPYSLPGHEIPDCDEFSQCLPPNGYRMGDYPTVGINSHGTLALFWSDFRNGGPCATDTDPGLEGLPVIPCDNYDVDILERTSTDGGATWSGARDVTKPGTTAQWQPWGAIGPDGRLYVAYYDRHYGKCESKGCNDITLARSGPSRYRWQHQRITTSSMPNLTCNKVPTECGFLGDYMGLALGGGRVHVAWGDTRGQNGTKEEDVYSASVPGG